MWLRKPEGPVERFGNRIPEAERRSRPILSLLEIKVLTTSGTVATAEATLIRDLCKGDVLYAGVHLIEKKATFAFYSSRPLRSEYTLRLTIFQAEKCQITSRPDPEWSYYVAHLLPTSKESEFPDIQAQVDEMAERKDLAFRLRPVTVRFLMPDDFDHEAMATELAGSGALGPPREGWCSLTIVSTVLPSDLNPLLQGFRQIADRYGCEAIAWDAPVVVN